MAYLVSSLWSPSSIRQGFSLMEWSLNPIIESDWLFPWCVCQNCTSLSHKQVTFVGHKVCSWVGGYLSSPVTSRVLPVPWALVSGSEICRYQLAFLAFNEIRKCYHQQRLPISLWKATNDLGNHLTFGDFHGTFWPTTRLDVTHS